jgi:hypothetical protein
MYTCPAHRRGPHVTKTSPTLADGIQMRVFVIFWNGLREFLESLCNCNIRYSNIACCH